MEVVRILFVDDEPDVELLMRQRFRKQIREGRYIAEFALNGKLALDILRENSDIQLIVTDINMPVMDGLTLLSHIAEIGRPVKVIVATAYGDMGNIRTAMNRGAFDFITKPVDFADLERTIEKTIVELSEANRAIETKNKLGMALVEKEEAERSAQFKQQFLANMSHEIRTPLNAIVGMTNLLAASDPLPGQMKYLKAMKQASSNLLNLVNDILDISKIEAGKINFEDIRFSLSGLMDSVYQTLSLKAEERHQKFSFSLEESAGDSFHGDPARIGQVLLNLCSNALKFTPEGGVIRMEASTEGSSVEGTVNVLFRVIDNGIGISIENIDRIFETFAQEKEEILRKYGGTGLGLAISRQLVELMGGTIGVKSEPGKGSEFFFMLPLKRSSSVAAEVHSPLPENESERALSLSILLAEDQLMNQMVACDTLEMLFPCVLIDIASNGREALEKIGKNQYDLVLMDIHMPEMDGLEATRRIRKLPGDRANIPVIALTANAIKEELLESKNAGMNEHITKPFDPERLRQVILENLPRGEDLIRN